MFELFNLLLQGNDILLNKSIISIFSIANGREPENSPAQTILFLILVRKIHLRSTNKLVIVVKLKPHVIY